MHSLLVTGSAGFIGSNFVHYWLRTHPQDRVVGFDALTYAGNKANLAAALQHPQFCFRHGNICDQEMVEALLRLHGVDTVVHFAAESHVDRSITGPDTFIETNVVGTHSLLKAAKNVWLGANGRALDHRFHHVSTDEVYGALTAAAPAFTEETLYRPNSPYSASKAASDHLVRAYHHTYGLQVTTSNCSNNYGPYQFPEKLIPVVILQAIVGQPIPVYGTGENVRDWLYVHDHCDAINMVLQKGTIGETYNVGGNNEIKNIQIVKDICTILDEVKPAESGKSYHQLITFVKDRPGHDFRYAINSKKIKQDLGWQPQETFQSGLRKTINWYLDNKDWWIETQKNIYQQERLGTGKPG